MMACSHSFLCCISVWGDTRVNPTLSDSTLLSLGLSEESILWLSSSIWTGVFPSEAASFEFCCDTLGWVPTAPLLSDVSLQGWQGNTFPGVGGNTTEHCGFWTSIPSLARDKAIPENLLYVLPGTSLLSVPLLFPCSSELSVCQGGPEVKIARWALPSFL